MSMSDSFGIERGTKAFTDLQRGLCPDCQTELMPGPRGGAAQNFYCTDREHCRLGFSRTLWQGGLVIGQHASAKWPTRPMRCIRDEW